MVGRFAASAPVMAATGRVTREGPFIDRWEAIVARMGAPGRREGKGCAVLDSGGRRCYLERGHLDRPHLRITHHVRDEKNEYVGLGWAEWTDEESLVTLPTRVCPHEAADRATCSHVECRAWRARIVEWAKGRVAVVGHPLSEVLFL